VQTGAIAAMKCAGLRALFAISAFQIVHGETSDAVAGANPIRRVVNMLEKMLKKVEAEGKKEEGMYEKYMCYCKTGAASLETTISEAETAIPKLESGISETDSKIGQLVSSIERAKGDRAEAKDAVKEAVSIRGKEAAAFAKESTELTSNIAALGKAVKALETGITGGFLQTSAAAVLRKITMTMEMNSADRDAISSFLAAGNAGETSYVPQSGEIVGILKQMKDTMEADLAEMTAAEDSSKTSFAELVAAKKAQIQTLTSEIETKLSRNGEAGVALLNMKADLKDTQASLGEDQAFLADMEKNCASKESEWQERQKTRADEILAIHETIKILNDDDALELFKKTLPSASLLQVGHTAKDIRKRALNALGEIGKQSPLAFVLFALEGRSTGFEKVIAMIDDMTALLKKEQADDAAHKSYCESEIDTTENTLKGLRIKISDMEAASDELKSVLAQLGEDIKSLTSAVKTLDGQVAEASEQRKAEHKEFVDTTAANNAAVELLGVAKNRLNQFYNHKLATTSPAFIQTGRNSAFEAPGKAPESWDGYAKKGQESTGVIAMIDLLIADVTKEIEVMSVEEKKAQADYEDLMKESAKKRAADMHSIATKQSDKADAEATLQKTTEEISDTKSAASAKIDALGALHSDCDWLLKYFDARKEARQGEIDSLSRAKAVLSGADYSFLQTNRERRL